jgi:hypothetical protein
LNPDGRSAVLLDAFSYVLVHFETLQPGWNNITWQGTPTPVTAAIASLAGQLDRVFAWDANRQAFDSFIVAAPSFLNSLTVLEPGQSLWVFLDGDAPAVWEQPLS